MRVLEPAAYRVATVPYSSDLCCIELKWLNGEGWVSNAVDQHDGRTCAEVVKLLRQKWFATRVDSDAKEKRHLEPKVWLDHVIHNINEATMAWRLWGNESLMPLDFATVPRRSVKAR